MRGRLAWSVFLLVVMAAALILRVGVGQEVRAYNQRLESFNAEYRQSVQAAIPREEWFAGLEKLLKELAGAASSQDASGMADAAAELAAKVQEGRRRFSSLSPPPTTRRLHEKNLECLAMKEAQALIMRYLTNRAAAGTLTAAQWNEGMRHVSGTEYHHGVCMQQAVALAEEVDRLFTARRKPLDVERAILERKLARYRFVALGLRLGSVEVELAGSR